LPWCLELELRRRHYDESPGREPQPDHAKESEPVMQENINQTCQKIGTKHAEHEEPHHTDVCRNRTLN